MGDNLLITQIIRRYARYETFFEQLKDQFPGLVDGETEVNGSDLMDFLTSQIEYINNEETN